MNVNLLSITASPDRDCAAADAARVRVLPRRQALRAGRPRLDAAGQGEAQPQPPHHGKPHHEREHEQETLNLNC